MRFSESFGQDQGKPEGGAVLGVVDMRASVWLVFRSRTTLVHQVESKPSWRPILALPSCPIAVLF